MNASDPIDMPPPPVQASLSLDPEHKRVFCITSPLVLTMAELERVRHWLEFQLIIEKEPE